MKNSMSFLPILSAALFVSLLPSVMGIMPRENAAIGAVPATDHLFGFRVRL